MAQPQCHQLPFDGTTLQPSAGSFALDPLLQSNNLESWAGQPIFSDDLSPDNISGFDQTRFGLDAPPSVGHIGFDHPNVGCDSQNNHNYSDHNVFASQPAQWASFPYCGNDHIVRDPVISPTSLNNYSDFNWSATYNHDGVSSHDELIGHLPVFGVRRMVMPAPQGHDQLLETALNQTLGWPLNNAYNTPAVTMPSLWGYGQSSHVGMGPDYWLPMPEAPSNSVLAVNQTAAEMSPFNAPGGHHPLMVYDRSEGPGEAWKSDMNAVETNRTQPSDNFVTLSPTVSAGVSLQTPQKQKAKKQIYSVCQICQYKAKSDGDLQRHARVRGHCILNCPYDECDGAFSSLGAQRKHWFDSHASDHDDHGRVRSGSGHACDECNLEFSSDTKLSEHGQNKQHSPYTCKCNEKFSRLDVLNRHLSNYQPGQPTYPCSHCKRHTGDKGFKRKEHLTQHLRNYHHIGLEELSAYAHHREFPVCSHLDCPQYRTPEFRKIYWRQPIVTRPFKSQAQYTKHLREKHDESTFPCDVPHCDRVGGKGYFREKDLMKHRKALHPDAIPYIAPERPLLQSCREPDCGRRWRSGFPYYSSLVNHYHNEHGYSWEEARDLAYERVV